MDLSKLTNPEDTVPLDDATKVINGNNVEINNDENVNVENDDNKKDRNEDEEVNSDRPIENEGKETQVRSTSDYRRLYNYLLEKYRNAVRSTKVLEEFELYLKNLSKYQQLRNNMLIDTLKYLNDHETLDPIDPTNTEKLTEKMKGIEKNDPRFSDLISKLRKLEATEDKSNPKNKINSFNDIVGINDALSSDLSILENNAFPDLYAGNFDLLELVKKNPCFTTEITSLTELNEQIRKEKVETIKRIELEHTHLPRKRKKVQSKSATPQPNDDIILNGNDNTDEVPNKRVKVESQLSA